jgi:peptidyl-prolyl cis-trans isomerase D
MKRKVFTMLDVMRNGSKNIFVKGFLGLLALSFIIWGVGDVFRNNTSAHSVATVGNTSISYDEYNNTLRRELARYQEILGAPMTEEQIEKFNIKSRVINQIVDSKIIRMRMDDLNFKVGNAAASDQIFANSMFFDESGKFSKENFDTIMQSNGLNKNDYVQTVKSETAIKLFIDSLTVRPKSLTAIAKPIYGYRNEQRIADLLYIPASYIKEVPDPSETDLVQYYQENTQKFSVPEMREVSYMTFNVKDIKNDTKISNEALKSEYDANIANYQEAEKRDVDQYLFETEKDAKAALADLKSGKSSAYSNKKTALGEVVKDSLPNEIRDAIFTVTKNSFSEPVNTQMGWHIFTVKNIVAGHTKSFDEVKASIEAGLNESKAAEEFSKYASQIEDDFAGGMSLEDVAKKYNLTVSKVDSVDLAGNNGSAKAISNLPEKEMFLPLVFKTESGAVSPLTLLTDNASYVAVRVDAVTPERVKALDEVKGIAIGMWKENAKIERLKAAAEDISEKLKSGDDLEKLASSLSLKTAVSKKISRPSEDALSDKEASIPPALAKQLFNIKTDEATDAYQSADGSFIVAKLKSIKDADVQETKLHNLETSLKDDFVNDVLSQYNTFLRKKYPVTVNQSLLSAAN